MSPTWQWTVSQCITVRLADILSASVVCIVRPILHYTKLNKMWCWSEGISNKYHYVACFIMYWIGGVIKINAIKVNGLHQKLQDHLLWCSCTTCVWYHVWVYNSYKLIQSVSCSRNQGMIVPPLGYLQQLRYSQLTARVSKLSLWICTRLHWKMA